MWTRTIFKVGSFQPIIVGDMRTLLRFFFDWKRTWGGDIVYKDDELSAIPGTTVPIRCSRIEYHMPTSDDMAIWYIPYHSLVNLPPGEYSSEYPVSI